MDAAQAIASIKAQINIPLIADIHFDYRLALAAAKAGADALRLNPGDVGSARKVKAVVDCAPGCQYAHLYRYQCGLSGEGSVKTISRGNR